MKDILSGTGVLGNARGDVARRNQARYGQELQHRANCARLNGLRGGGARDARGGSHGESSRTD